MNARARGYAFTVNNDTFEDLCQLLEMPADYLCFGFEEGERGGTEHIQGYCYFRNKITRRVLARDYLSRAHIEVAKGTPRQNRVYCSKDEEFYEFGDVPSENQRSDILHYIEVIRSGVTDEAIAEECPLLYARYPNMVRLHRALREPKERSHVHISENEILATLRTEYNDKTVCFNIETYQGEDVLIYQDYSQVKINLDAWLAGYPQYIKMGYQLLKVDPEIIISYI